MLHHGSRRCRAARSLSPLARLASTSLALALGSLPFAALDLAPPTGLRLVQTRVCCVRPSARGRRWCYITARDAAAPLARSRRSRGSQPPRSISRSARCRSPRSISLLHRSYISFETRVRYRRRSFVGRQLVIAAGAPSRLASLPRCSLTLAAHAARKHLARSRARLTAVRRARSRSSAEAASRSNSRSLRSAVCSRSLLGCITARDAAAPLARSRRLRGSQLSRSTLRSAHCRSPRSISLLHRGYVSFKPRVRYRSLSSLPLVAKSLTPLVLRPARVAAALLAPLAAAAAREH